MTDRYTLDNGDAAERAQWLTPPGSRTVTAHVVLYFTDVEVPGRSLAEAARWISDEDNLDSLLIGLRHHDSLAVLDGHQPLVPATTAALDKLTLDTELSNEPSVDRLLHTPQGLAGLQAVRAALSSQEAEVLLNLHGSYRLDSIARAKLHRDLDRLVDAVQGLSQEPARRPSGE